MSTSEAHRAQRRKLPEAYCLDCAKERPEQFSFILEAEDDGAIVSPGYCPRHLVPHLVGSGFSARLENGRIVIGITGRVFEANGVLPESGMLWRTPGIEQKATEGTKL